MGGAPPDVPPAVLHLVEACLSFDPGKRPPMRQVLVELEAISLPET